MRYSGTVVDILLELAFPDSLNEGEEELLVTAMSQYGGAAHNVNPIPVENGCQTSCRWPSPSNGRYRAQRTPEVDNKLREELIRLLFN